MSKKFNIHDWQSKQRLGEMQSMDFGPNCPQYDGPRGEGIMAKGNAMELANDASDVAGMIGPNTNLPEWVESKITLAANYLNKVKDYLTHYDASREKLMEQGFDSRLAKQMGMSDDEFEKNIASRDIGDTSSFMDDDDPRSPGEELADRTIADFRKKYRGMSDDDLDDFSAKMVEHLLDNLAAQARAKVLFAKRGI